MLEFTKMTLGISCLHNRSTNALQEFTSHVNDSLCKVIDSNINIFMF